MTSSLRIPFTFLVFGTFLSLTHAFGSMGYTTFESGSYIELSAHLEELNFKLQDVRSQESSVPRLRIKELPNDMRSIKNVKTKKKIFLSILLPLILKANEEILSQRRRLLRLKNSKQQPLSLSEKMWLSQIAEQYRLKAPNIETLLKRVDAVPVSLALAQALLEAGWGTSEPALSRNSVFGNTVNGRVTEYKTLYECVQSYIRNLNTNRAYREFRTARLEKRKKGETLCGHDLAITLTRYSERKTAYVKHLQKAIELNRLKDFDTARLEPAETASI
jgi:Bax protein